MMMLPHLLLLLGLITSSLATPVDDFHLATQLSEEAASSSGGLNATERDMCESLSCEFICKEYPGYCDYIHCVCSDTGGGSCFSLDTVVSLSSGHEVAMADLVLGDSVLVMGEDGTSHYSEFLGWLDKSVEKDTAFLQIETDAGDKLKLTGSHVLFAYKSGDVVPVFADSLVVGDLLVGSNIPVKNITSITSVVAKGYVDPLTYFIANGIASSCYASFDHYLANLALLPARLAPTLLLDDEQSVGLDGTRGYVDFIKYVGGYFRQRNKNKVSDASWENPSVIDELWSLDYQLALSHVIESFY